MAIIIQRPQAPPSGSNPLAIIPWLVSTLTGILDALRGLLTLDADVRDTRTRVAERAVAFFQTGDGGIPALTDAAVLVFGNIYPDTVTQYFTTALIQFDAASDALRWRTDGQNPSTTVGMPIPANGYSLTITGALNIRSFAVICEAGGTATMSVTLFK